MDYSVTMNITLPEEKIRAAVLEYGEHTFDRPVFTKGNVGYQLVKEQVDAYIATLDLTEMIKYELTPIINRVVNEVIAGEIGKHIRDIVYRELRDKTTVELK